MAGSRFADVRWVDETGSTNADVAALARAGAPDGVVVVAEYQRRGRGRLARTWVAPPGSSLLCSILFRPGLAPASAYRMANAVGVAAAEACRAEACRAKAGRAGTDVAVGLKWPNDLVVGDRKLGGILAESVMVGGHLVAVVVGLGINVNWPRRDTAARSPVHYAGPGAEVATALAAGATALNHEAGRDLDRELLLVAMLRRLDTLEPAGAPFARRYRSLLRTLGRRVRVTLAAGADRPAAAGPGAGAGRPGAGAAVIEGIAVDVDVDGRLVVEDDAGVRHEVAVGDVEHLRTPPG